MSTPNHDVYKERGENEFHHSELTLKEFEGKLTKVFKYISFFSQQFEACNVILPAKSSKAVAINGFDAEKAEYLIAVCSNSPLEDIQSQVYVRTDDKYKQVFDWAVANHKIVEENNITLKAQRDEIESEKAQSNNKQGHIEILLQTERDLLSDKNNLLEQCRILKNIAEINKLNIENEKLTSKLERIELTYTHMHRKSIKVRKIINRLFLNK